MTKFSLTIFFACTIALAGALTACWKDNPNFCERDTECDVAAGARGKFCNVDLNACAATAQPAPKKKNSEACGEAGECKSGFCIDGVCCEKNCGNCQVCNADGKQGTCQNLPVGPAPVGECPNVDQGCARCDGQGACVNASEGTVCDESCSNGQYASKVCNKDAKCGAVPDQSCTPGSCDGEGKRCTKACVSHDNCVTGSVCDRSQAHVSGFGECIAVDKVVVYSTGTLQQSITDALAANKTHLRINAPKTFSESAELDGIKFSIIGVPSGANVVNVGLIAANKEALSIKNKANVSLQGLTVTSSTGNNLAHGIKCTGQDGMNRASLSIVEATVKSNEGLGIKSTDCDLNIHRSIVSTNAQGGIDISGGASKVFNTVIASNGTLGSSQLGGIRWLTSMQTDSFQFVNNTIFANQAGNSISAGVICGNANPVIQNSILWSNGATPIDKCSVERSIVQGTTAPPGEGNSVNDPAIDANQAYRFTAQTAPPVNWGQDNLAGSLDLSNTIRKKGSAVDLGAYEIQ